MENHRSFNVFGDFDAILQDTIFLIANFHEQHHVCVREDFVGSAYETETWWSRKSKNKCSKGGVRSSTIQNLVSFGFRPSAIPYAQYREPRFLLFKKYLVYWLKKQTFLLNSLKCRAISW